LGELINGAQAPKKINAIVRKLIPQYAILLIRSPIEY